MNRRRFAGAALGAGVLLVATAPALPALAHGGTTTTAPIRPFITARETLGENVVSSLRRTYGCDDPPTYLSATAVVLDTKRHARDVYDRLVDGGVETFDGMVVDDEGEHGDLADEGYLFNGILEEEEVNIAVFYVLQGKVAYGIASAGEGDQVEIVTAYYESLLDEDREDSDLLLTEDEMPRGFSLLEDVEDFASEDE